MQWKPLGFGSAPNCLEISRITFEHQPPRLVRWGFHASPFDPLMIGLTEDGVLCRIEFARGRKRRRFSANGKRPGRARILSKIKKRRAKSCKTIIGKAARKGQLKLQMTGTEFQLAVWKELLKIPAGETISYPILRAASKNRKPCARSAMPWAPIRCRFGAVPSRDCNRRQLGGFGGGLELKRKLLEAEGTKAA